MHLPSPDLIDHRIRIQQCFYQTEASYGKQSQLLSAPAQITISTQAPQLEASKQWADALPSQSTSPILCPALSLCLPLEPLAGISWVVPDLPSSITFNSVSTVGSHWEVTGPQKGSLVSS